MNDAGKGFAFGCGLVPGFIIGCLLLAILGVLGCLTGALGLFGRGQ